MLKSIQVGKKLSRFEMKEIHGGVAPAVGGTCQALIADGVGGRTHVETNLTMAQASTGNPDMIHWCCSSCATASWAV